jgi:hypothetical protein
LEESHENHMSAKQFKDDIDGHAKEAAEHYQTALEIEEAAIKTMDQAKLDKYDVEKLKALKLEVEEHV